MARVYFPDRDPIGERIWFDSFSSKEQWMTIVGIAGDVHQSSLIRSTFPQAYTCYTQQTFGAILNGGTLVVRTSINPTALSESVRAAIRAVNPDAAPSTRTMESVLAKSIAKQQFQMEILAGFAVLALLLAAIGLYGVMSHMVATNRAEIGIRLALGASRNLIFRMVAGRALTLTTAGVLVGILGCIALRRVLATLIFGIGPTDPAMLAAAVAILMAAALTAAWLPARRAARVDPMVALRDE
jgi:ABC-type antimicrobial peptide transport system permease subunit